MGTEAARRIAVRRLAGETLADPRTAARWLRGERVTPFVDAALSAAAARLGIARETSAAESPRAA